MVIVTETIGVALWKNEFYQKIEKSFLGPRGQRRLHAAAAGIVRKEDTPIVNNVSLLNILFVAERH